MDNPKGALTTTRSLTLATNVIYTIGYHLSGVDIILSFLLLAHIMEQLIFTVCLLYGTRIGFSSGKIILGDDSNISVLIIQMRNTTNEFSSSFSVCSFSFKSFFNNFSIFILIFSLFLFIFFS